MPPTPIQSPASYIPSRATAFAAADGTAQIVSAASPMPVTFEASASPTPLAGSATGSTVVGPFIPSGTRAVMLVLSGTWAGTVRILRSTDGGTTKIPLTIGGSPWGQFTGNICEPVWEESEANARLYLEVTLTSGTLVYRMAQ